MPDYLKHAKSLALEFNSVKDKVRNLTDHWPSDGVHKEHVLKSIISQKIPKRYEIVSGFIVTPHSKSSQIDLMIIDSEKPILDRSGANDVFVTPDAVRAIIEVKTKLSGSKQYLNAIKKLTDNKKLCFPFNVWAGLFVVEFDKDVSYWSGPDDIILNACDMATNNQIESSINCVSVGDSLFIRFWENSRLQVNGLVDGSAWHSYFMHDLAPAYFLGNLIDAITPIPDEYSFVWFPIPDGKESLRRWYKQPGQQPDVFPNYFDTLKINGIWQQLEKINKYRNINRP